MRQFRVHIGGFKDISWRHLVTWPIRRWSSADWFQPIAPPAKPMPKHFYEDKDYGGEAKYDPTRLAPDHKIPLADLPAAEKIRAKYTLRKTYVSNFAARSDGELIFYVNDAVAAIPFLRPYKGFYANNTGVAKVTIKRLVAAPP